VGRRRLLLAGTLVIVSLLAFMLTYLLLQDTNLALLAFGGILGIGIVFAQPFIGLITYFVFLYIRPQDFARAMQGLPIMLALGAVTALLMVLHMAVKQRRIVITDAPQNLLMLWLLAAIFLSNMSHMLVDGAIGEVTDFIPTLVMYFLITNLVTTEKRLKFTVNVLLLLTLVLCFSGVLQHITGVGFGGQESYKGRIQAIGIFNDPNDLAMALVIVLPFVLLKVLEPAPPWQKLDFAVHLLSVEDGELRTVTGDNPAWDGAPYYSPDGRYLLFGRNHRPEISPDFTRLARYDRESGEIVELAASGVLNAFATAHRQTRPGATSPLVVGSVLLDDGPAVEVILDVEDASGLAIGQRVGARLVEVGEDDDGRSLVDCYFAPIEAA